MWDTWQQLCGVSGAPGYRGVCLSLPISLNLTCWNASLPLTHNLCHSSMHAWALCVCVCFMCPMEKKKKRADCTSDWLTGELQSLDSVIFNFRFNQANEHNEQQGLCSVRMIRKNEQNWDSGRYKHNIHVTMVVVWGILCWVSSCRLQHQNRTKTLCRHYVPFSRLCIRYR